MISPEEDRQLNTLMRDWAQHSVNAIDTSRLETDTARLAAPAKRLPRWVPVAAAAALTMIVIAVGLLVRVHAEKPSPVATTALRCPARAPIPPSDPSPTSSAPMLNRPIEALIVCSYSTRLTGQHAGTTIRTVRLPRAFARKLAERLNHAPTTAKDPDLCLFVPGFSALIARDATGHALPTITVRPGCAYLAFLTPTSTRYLPAADPVVQQIRATIAHAATTN